MRLNEGMPVWHVSITAWSPDGTRQRSEPTLCKREAVKLLRGVGGAAEWWLWNAATKVGHLRVAVTGAEHEQIPPACVIADAGPSGPKRPRTR